MEASEESFKIRKKESEEHANLVAYVLKRLFPFYRSKYIQMGLCILIYFEVCYFGVVSYSLRRRTLRNYGCMLEISKQCSILSTLIKSKTDIYVNYCWCYFPYVKVLVSGRPGYELHYSRNK